jgi:chromosome segregation ATPase
VSGDLTSPEALARLRALATGDEAACFYCDRVQSSARRCGESCDPVVAIKASTLLALLDSLSAAHLAVNNLMGDRETLRAEARTLREQRNLAEDENRRVHALVDSMDVERAALRAERDEAKKEADEATHVLAWAKRFIGELQDSREKVQAERDRLSAIVDAAKGSGADLIDALVMSEQAQRLDATRDAARSALEVALAERDTLRLELVTQTALAEKRHEALECAEEAEIAAADMRRERDEALADLREREARIARLLSMAAPPGRQPT